jgi:Tol biopolymer transport system component
MFSPDGRWMAYVSNESGNTEVYVRPFSGPGGKWQISAGVGSFPAWSKVRQELFYRAGIDARIMMASYAVNGESFRANKSNVVAERRTLQRPRQRSYTVHPDGERFAMAPIAENTATTPDRVVFVFNFFDELRRIAPAGDSIASGIRAARDRLPQLQVPIPHEGIEIVRKRPW